MIFIAGLEDHEHACDNIASRPKWKQFSLQVVGNIVSDPMNTRRTRSQFEEASHALLAT